MSAQDAQDARERVSDFLNSSNVSGMNPIIAVSAIAVTGIAASAVACVRSNERRIPVAVGNQADGGGVTEWEFSDDSVTELEFSDDTEDEQQHEENRTHHRPQVEAENGWWSTVRNAIIARQADFQAVSIVASTGFALAKFWYL